MSPGWAETIWLIEVMSLGLFSKGLLIDTLESFPLVPPWPLVGIYTYVGNIREECSDPAELPG